MNELSYILFIIFGILFVVLRLKKSKYKSPQDLTLEFLRKKQAENSFQDYAKWLRIEYTFCRAVFLERKEKGMSISPSFIDGVKLLEQEMENIEKQYGMVLFTGKTKLSEEIGQEYNKKVE
jgi:hypothetical protein